MRGRCSGCGYESGRRLRLKIHLVACPRFSKTLRTKPERIKPPELEYVWWSTGLAEIKTIQASLEVRYHEAQIKVGVRS